MATTVILPAMIGTTGNDADGDDAASSDSESDGDSDE